MGCASWRAASQMAPTLISSAHTQPSGSQAFRVQGPCLNTEGHHQETQAENPPPVQRPVERTARDSGPASNYIPTTTMIHCHQHITPPLTTLHDEANYWESDVLKF